MKLYNFIIKVMKNKVMDVAFSFKLKQLDDVTLRRIRYNHAFEMAGHTDTLEGWWMASIGTPSRRLGLIYRMMSIYVFIFCISGVFIII